MHKTDKGHIFSGFFSGATYDHFTGLVNVSRFFIRALHNIPLKPGMHVLDLGCGTGSFDSMIAQHIGTTGSINGVDLSATQLARAREKMHHASVPCTFHKASIDELPFEDSSFDAVVSSFVFHHVPPNVRREAIRETARVLKPGGFFALVDMSTPRFGIMGIMGIAWFASHWLTSNVDDHWYNTYPDLCRANNLYPDNDVYLNSIIRCQVFCKQEDV